MRTASFITCIILFLCSNGLAQIMYEEGYFVNNAGDKIACLIRNVDWKDTPTKFDYKLSKDSSEETASIESVKEFGIAGQVKYVRSQVDIDRSNRTLETLSPGRDPVFTTELLFLKVLVEGEANLYEYSDGFIRFFYNKDSSEIRQLIYKNYALEGNKIGVNNSFRQQLWIDLKCPTINMTQFERLNYNKKDLVRLFIEYNNCNNPNPAVFNQKPKKDLFNLTFKPGLSFNSLEISNSLSEPRSTAFKSQMCFRFGIEAEYVLPFNKNKWSVTFEPTYQNFQVENTKQEQFLGSVTAHAKYTSVELPIGLKYYIFLNKLSKMFLTGSFVTDVVMDGSEITFIRSMGTPLEPLEINSTNNFGFGIGYKFQDKFSIEGRYQTSRQILADYVSWTSDFETVSVFIGYSIF